ncbi:MAG: NusG domain II-containing protein [Clostridiales bacterium]|uniref:NusG domain II-containing protein n=1 Tax=Flavonifractor porci TaxID=3133422 RepID=UPI0030A18785|nr:NusG domain II-containing protein [Clostridiales bacterium]
MRSPAADRRRPTLWDGLVALITVAFAVFLVFFLRPTEGSAIIAVVTLDGETVVQYRLDQLSQPVTLDVEDGAYPLTIRAEQGRICIEHSDCPSQDCVRTGWISRPGQQIICLPDRLIISLSGTEPEPFDAVTG